MSVNLGNSAGMRASRYEGAKTGPHTEVPQPELELSSLFHPSTARWSIFANTVESQEGPTLKTQLGKGKSVGIRPSVTVSTLVWAERYGDEQRRALLSFRAEGLIGNYVNLVASIRSSRRPPITNPPPPPVGSEFQSLRLLYVVGSGRL